MKGIYECKGDFVKIDGHSIHIYRKGNVNKPKIILMSGSGTISPEYDFKVHNRMKNTTRVNPTKVIFVEGILVLEDKKIRDLSDVKQSLNPE